MKGAARNRRSKRSRGFTLVELLVVVMIIAILATVGLPQYFRTVERSRLAEATNLCSAYNTAQQRYYMVKSAHATTFNNLDIDPPTMKFFNIGTVGGSATVFNLTLARNTAAPGAGAPGVNTSYSIRCAGDSGGASNVTCPSCPGYLDPT